MENEASLLEQIKSYIDQLDLLGMQAELDQPRIDNVVERVKELATEYETLLDKKAETEMQKAEAVYAQNLEEEQEKRKNILSAISEKLEAFNALFSRIFQIKTAANLQEHITTILDKLKSQVNDYEGDLKLVEEQITATKNAEEKEALLNDDKTKANIAVTNLRNAQIPYEQLNEEIKALYFNILNEGNANQIDFTAVQQKEEAFVKRQGRYLENLELARSAKNAEEYVTMYEERVKNGKLELDKLAEQKFLHLLKKMLTSPVDSYETLDSRTKTIQGMVISRCSQVEELYQEGIVKKEEYETLASKINHDKIFSQLNDLEEIAKHEKTISTIEEKLKHVREGIKGTEELENIFADRAKAKGREVITPVQVITPTKQPEILFDDEQPSMEKPTSSSKRHLVISVAPPKPSLLDKIKKAKEFSASTLATIGSIPSKVKELTAIPEQYKPSIGDKIKLGDTTMIFTNPMDVAELKDGKDAKSINLIDTELYVTRGAILDYTKSPIYITSDFGVNLEEIAKEMNLQPGTYSIALGCSIGDNDGKFIGVTDDKLNPDIEKGWISAADSKLQIVTQLTEELQKGGMNK